MDRRIFIGDVHANSGELINLIGKLGLKETDEYVFLGDYIDKGNSPIETLEILEEISVKLPNTRFLWGNHDLMFYEWLLNQNPVYEQTFEGQQTIKQMVGGKNPQLVKGELFKRYEWLFNKMEFHVEFPEQVAVHGGLIFNRPDPINDTNKYEKVNTRMFMSGNPLNKPIIVGHTPQPKIMLTKDRKMVNIDTGSGSGGELSALIYFVEYDFYKDKDGFGVDVLPLNEF